jgi:hypothetical protein
MKIMKAKSIFALILFSVLTLGLASIATSAVTRITDNAFEDSFPKTAGGYVVWQGQPGFDWEIFFYNANNGSGPTQITINSYHDVGPEIDGNYVTWSAAAADHGEIFVYDILAGGDPVRLTEIWDLDPTIINTRYDHNPNIVDGKVVWVSHSEGVDTDFGPGDIWLYDIDKWGLQNISINNFQNISEAIDPGNIHNDSRFIFDGNRIQWAQETLGDTLNWAYDPLAGSWGQQTTVTGYIRNYVYDLATGSIYRYYIPEDDGDDIVPYVVEDLTAGTTYQTTESPYVRVDPQSDGDFSVAPMYIGGGSDREIELRDRQVKRGGRITANSINDTQAVIKDNIVVWKGDEGNNSEIYLYKIPLLFANAGYDIQMDIANLDQMVIRGKAGGANQYRWLLGESPLTDWLEVVDGQAPLNLANKSGFTRGPQTLALEVTDGTTLVSDYMTMNLEAWPLKLVSPADGSEQPKGIYPEFAWSSSYRNFKIQISQTPGFGDAETVTHPSASDEWIISGDITSFTADDATTQELNTLLSESSIAHWRVVARDHYGNIKASETRSFIIIPPVRLVSPRDGIQTTASNFKKNPPVFVWESSEDYIGFKIQFSVSANFEEMRTFTIPESTDAWLNETSITLDRKQVSAITELIGNQDTGPNYYLYWRVLAQDTSGNKEITEARHIFLPK